MCQSQYHDVSCEGRLLNLEQPASVFCYNYSSLKEDVHISTAALQESSESYFAQSSHLRLLSLDQSNYSYSAQLSVS